MGRLLVGIHLPTYVVWHLGRTKISSTPRNKPAISRR